MPILRQASLLGRSLLTMALLQVLRSEHAWADAAEPLTETDRTMLAQAARACRAQDYKSLFNAMISSPAARDKYAAREIAYEEMNAQVTGKKSWIPKESYEKFPIKMFDFYRKPTVPAKAGDEDEYVMVEFNQSQSNRFSVEWTRVHFRGQPGEGDDLGKPFDLDGEPYDPGRRTDGQLLLYPTKDCWELVSDIRYVMP